jgi:hypothetical protein
VRCLVSISLWKGVHHGSVVVDLFQISHTHRERGNHARDGARAAEADQPSVSVFGYPIGCGDPRGSSRRPARRPRSSGQGFLEGADCARASATMSNARLRGALVLGLGVLALGAPFFVGD